MADFQLPIDLSHREYDLAGPEGNAFAVMGAVTSVLKQMGRAWDIPFSEIDRVCKEYTERAKSGDYENLLKVSEEYVLFTWIHPDYDDFDYEERNY